MKGQAFVTDAVRAMLEWAADPDRGALLPDSFHNPFRRLKGLWQVLKGDPLAEPDITLTMAVSFVRACDPFQRRLFVPLILYGLRPSELCFLFREYLAPDWLQVPCHPELHYLTKGRRSKRLPLLEELGPFWESLRQGAGHGLVYERRPVVEGRETAPRRGASLPALVTELHARGMTSASLDAAARLRLRDTVLREAGAMSYDDVEQEFRGVARRLKWPPAATLKDFRHLFATMLGNTPMAEAYKKYLLGQSVGRAALMAYTHLNELRQQYTAAVRRAWAPLVEAILQQPGQNAHS
jgi:integrase